MKQPELKSKTNEFWSHLHMRTKYTKGWDVKCVYRKEEWDKPYAKK